MSKKLTVLGVGVVAALFVAFSLSPTAYAHFTVHDTKTGMKALFHVTPDHDPIAGKESTVSFDFSKTSYKSKDFTYSLTVKATKGGEAVAVPAEIVSNVVLAEYSFPSQGLYNITLDAEPKNGTGQTSTLMYSQRVTRGIIKKESAFPPYAIAAMVVTPLIAVFAVALSSKDDSIKGSKRKREQHETVTKK